MLHPLLAVVPSFSSIHTHQYIHDSHHDNHQQYARLFDSSGAEDHAKEARSRDVDVNAFASRPNTIRLDKPHFDRSTFVFSVFKGSPPRGNIRSKK